MSSLLNNTSNISELAIEDQLPTLDNPNAANENVVEGEIGGGEIQPTEAQHLLQGLWQKQLDDVRNINLANFKIQELPLARIKKIMKMDEDVKMISAEAPMLFAKAAQMFITELSLRAWIHTEENKRRTLQRNDIATAITKFDQFDFLIDIVPREELKPAGREDGSMPSGSGVQYFYTIPQQQTAATPSQPQQVATPAPSQILLAQSGGQVIQLGAGNQLLTSGTSGLLTSGSSAEPQLVQFVQQSPQQQLQVQKPATPAPGPAVVKNDSSDVGASINQETLQQLIANSGLSANEIQSIQITPDGQVLLVKKASNATPLQGQVVQQVHNMAGVQQQASSVMSSSTAENDDDGPTLIDIAALHHQMDQQQQQPTKSIVYVQRSST